MSERGEDLPGESMVTQLGKTEIGRRGAVWFGRTFSFRSGLRPTRNELDMSVLDGRISVAEVVSLICIGDDGGLADAVRYALVSDLKTKGFTVKHSPSKTIPIHVSVTYSGEWDADIQLKFDLCFDQFGVHGGTS
jgi:hypothetical protein